VSVPGDSTLAASAPALADGKLRVTEIFYSLQGETSRVGLPTVFIRLTGCPLRCLYCDTAYAFHGGDTRTIQDVIDEAGTYATPYVTVTGGEPLAQKNCLALLTSLAGAGYSVSLETSGALDISLVDGRVSRILDIKTPGSGEVDRNRWDNLRYLNTRDEIKFVLCDERDYLWARDVLEDRVLYNLCPVLFSPVHGALDPTKLAEWILRDRLQVRMQIQLHKYLWGDEPGR
jgi:7-carboxy-7-deazaguanine synthase